MTNSIYQPITLNDPRLLQFAEQLNPGASPIYLPVIDKPGPRETPTGTSARRLNRSVEKCCWAGK